MERKSKLTDSPTVQIPSDLLPKDGRFGSGPSKIRPEAISSLVDVSTTYLGTSHRQSTVRDVVGRLRNGLAELFSLPSDYEVVLGNGGATQFWDIATFSLIRRRSQHLSFGEFSSKFASAAALAPHLEDPDIVSSEPGTRPKVKVDDTIDLYALTHNETSTGVMMEIERPLGAESAIVAVDATSGAAGLKVDAAEFDCYYFSPQKCFASEGGLWIALMSPKALRRVEEIKETGRFVPATLDLSIAVENSRLNQTYNTPALATIYLTVNQIEWFLENGGLKFSTGRCSESADILYGWAEGSTYATPFVQNVVDRSLVVGTIDFDPEIDALSVAKTLRANGIVDVEPYRKLGRNQIRVAMFPSIDPSDVYLLTKAIDYVVHAIK
jgi:phosphoserine aminotransferase